MFPKLRVSNKNVKIWYNFHMQTTPRQNLNIHSVKDVINKRLVSGRILYSDLQSMNAHFFDNDCTSI